MKRLHPDLKTGTSSSSTRFDPNAYHAGKAAGRSIYQGGALGTSSYRALGGKK